MKAFLLLKYFLSIRNACFNFIQDKWICFIQHNEEKCHTCMKSRVFFHLGAFMILEKTE